MPSTTTAIDGSPKEPLIRHRGGSGEDRSSLLRAASGSSSESTAAAGPLRAPPGYGLRTSLIQVILLSVSFCLTFQAFSSAQNFATSRVGSVGSTSVGILYAVFTFSNLLSGALVRIMGPKVTLFLGSLTYAAFVAANIVYGAAVMYSAAALLGFGAALIWTAQGVYVARAAAYHEVVHELAPRSALGKFNGLFWAIFQCAQLTGNLLVAVLFAKGVSTGTVFTITTIIALCGSTLLLFLRPLPNPEDEAEDAAAAIADAEDARARTPIEVRAFVGAEGAEGEAEADEVRARPVRLTARQRFAARAWSSVRGTMEMVFDARMLLMVPVIVYSGISQGFIGGQFPPLIHEKSFKFYALAAFGASDAASSFVAGLVSDRFGRRPVLLLGAAVHLAVYVLLLCYEVAQSEKWLFVLIAVAWGLGDACFNTQLYAITGSFFSDRTESAFSFFKLVQAGTTAAVFLYEKAIGFEAKMWILVATLVVGMLVLGYVDRAVQSLEYGTKKNGEEDAAAAAAASASAARVGKEASDA